MITIEQLHWVAGILEGEGTFCFKNGPGSYKTIRVALSMVDRDVVYKAANLFGFGSMHSVPGASRPATLQHRWTVIGVNAAALMMTLYPLMGERRQAKIRELLAFYRAIPACWRKDKGGKTFC